MIFDESSKDKFKNSLKFDFPFRAENIAPPSEMNSLSPNKPPSNPTTPTGTSCPKHDYSDPGVFYVCRDYFASSAEHLNVFVDDELEIVEELPGGSWTRVRERESQNTGLIPTDILESGAERLAKENKSSNQDTIRAMSCGYESNHLKGHFRRKSSKSRKSVSFSETQPEVINYPVDSDEHLLFPFALNEGTAGAIAGTEAIGESPEAVDAFESVSTGKHTSKKGFLSRLFKASNKPQSEESTRILETLKTFENYPDHLIRVYTGNFDCVLHAYKTFIVDETLTFHEFSQMVLGTFQLDADGFAYEVNLINHLTAEIIPLDLDFSIEQVIELTKREGMAFSAQMPNQLKKTQRGALKKLQKQLKGSQAHNQQQLNHRDKSTDYVTPFKFVLNRIYGNSHNVPIYIHLSLAYTPDDSEDNERNLILSSLFPIQDSSRNMTKKKKKKWFKFGKKQPESFNSTSNPQIQQVVHRIPTTTQTPLHVLIHGLLESLQVPASLPEILFEASLPAIHDAVELPLPMNMPIGEVLKIRPKLDPAEQVIIIRPIIIRE